MNTKTFYHKNKILILLPKQAHCKFWVKQKMNWFYNDVFLNLFQVLLEVNLVKKN